MNKFFNSMLGGDNLSILHQESLGPGIKAAIWLGGGLCPGWLTYFGID
jgi:hypothetical protein